MIRRPPPRALDLNIVDYAICDTCGIKHQCSGPADARNFFNQHCERDPITGKVVKSHRLRMKTHRPITFRHRIRQAGIAASLAASLLISADTAVDFYSKLLPLDLYSDNSNIKEALGTATAFTKTNANLSSSVTAGWKSNSVDNTSNLYIDAFISIELAAVNTAPAGTKTLYIFGYSLIEGSAYSSTGDGTIDGSEGTVTFPSVTTLPVCLPLVTPVPYPVQNKAINSTAASMSKAFFSAPSSGMPNKWGVAMVNDTAMTLSVTNFYYEEVYFTVV